MFKNIFYILFSVFLLIMIMRIFDKIMKSQEEKSKVVIVPGFNNLFGRPFFRRGIRRFGLPWVGPRVGGYYVGPFGRKYRNVGRRAMRKAGMKTM